MVVLVAFGSRSKTLRHGCLQELAETRMQRSLSPDMLSAESRQIISEYLCVLMQHSSNCCDFPSPSCPGFHAACDRSTFLLAAWLLDFAGDKN